MDLIGSVRYIGNKLGGRKPNQSKGKPAQKNTRNNAVDEKMTQADSSNPPTEYDTRLGRKIDTTA